MFTTDQIKEAHSKVKSGKDFPAYIQDLKQLGVVAYEHYISDASIIYSGADKFEVTAAAKYAPLKIAEISDAGKLKQALKIHQNGETDYLTFCKQSAEAGVEKWIVDIEKMTCIYYDQSGKEMILETIPL